MPTPRDARVVDHSDFFHGLHRSAQEHLDAAAGGSFLSLSITAAKNLIEKMATNQGWRKERSSTCSRGVHQIESTDMLAAKMDLLLKKLSDTPEAAPVQALDAHMTCEVCGNMGHSGNNCPERDPKMRTSSVIVPIASTMGIVLSQDGIHDHISLSLGKVTLQIRSNFLRVITLLIKKL